MNTMRRTRTRARGLRAGFTLTELLVATAITLIFGTLAVATLRYGSVLWRDAHRRGYAYDIASFIFHQVEDGFVRGIPEETPNLRLRQAGDGLDNDGDTLIDEQYHNLKQDPVDTDPVPDGVLDAFDVDVDEDLLPLEGVCEVAYLRGLDGTPGTGDAHTLYRGVLSPIGETLPLALDPGFQAAWPEYDGFNVTLFDGYFLGDDPNDILVPGLAAARVQAKAVPLAQDVLHFEVRCWTQYTTTWETVLPPPVPAWVGFSSLTWDSDRLVIDPIDPFDPARTGPVFFMDWGQPGFPDGDDDGDDDSLPGTPQLAPNSGDTDYVRDNVFPRAIMVVVVTDPSEEYPEARPLRLAPAGVAAGGLSIPVTGNVPAYNQKWPYLLIEDPDVGDEWVRFTEFDAATSSFMLAAPADRGVRGTLDAAHGATQLDGSPTQVKFGHTFSRVFYNPALREQ